MDYQPYDSSGTDDDLPPSHQNRVPSGGRLTGNGRSIVGSVPYGLHNDMEAQIHILEQEAYFSVLRAFKAQADVITWEKQGLMTELRKELRLCNDYHRELIGSIDADDILCRIRKWRQAGGHLSGLHSTAQPVHDPIPSPTASHKRQKTSQSGPTPSLNAPSASLHPQTVAPSMQPSSSAAKRGSAAGSRNKKLKPVQTLPGVPTMKSMQHPSGGPTARVQVANHGSSGDILANETADAAALDLIGRRLMTRWPEDNNFYEAVIAEYKEGLHGLVYDMNTAEETWEWVNLKEISPEDIRWQGDYSDLSHRGGRNGQGRGSKKSGSRGAAGRGRGTARGQSKKDFPSLPNGIGRRVPNELEIFHTDSLVKEVERVVSASHPDPLEIEKARKVLKEHEQALIDAIARLADVSDGESDQGERTISHQQSMDQDRGWRNRTYGVNQSGFEDETGGGRGEAAADVGNMMAE